MRKCVMAIFIFANLFSCKSQKEISTVEVFNPNKYQGVWYELARLPNSFEKGLDCITATYSLKKNGKIQVLNKGHLIEDKTKVKVAKGTAWMTNADFQGRLKVSFFWPFAADYYIMYLDEAYTCALVGTPTKKYLWILSRTPQMKQETYNYLLDIARKNEFDVENLIMVQQDCDTVK
jgi:apolipoprotein D and lipocalin family protein